MSASVFPARAGMSRRQKGLSKLFRCVPRASGDEPKFVRPHWVRISCSPRERG